MTKPGKTLDLERVLLLALYTAYAGTFFVQVFFFYPSEERSYLAHFADDAFYYFEIVRHFVESGVSTFDTLTTTNGYHPLWFLLLVLLGIVCNVDSPAFFAAVLSLDFALCLVGSFALRRVLARIYGSTALAQLLAAFYFFTAFRFSAAGMEIALFFGLAPLLLNVYLDEQDSPSVRKAVVFGLLASLVILSRLDSVLLVALLILFVAPVVRRRTHWHGLLVHGIAFGLGGLLLPLYLAQNLWFHGHVLPVSGLAKGMSSEWGLYWPAIEQLFRVRGMWDVIVPAGGAVAVLLAVPAGARISRREFAAAPVLLFALLFFPITAVRSQWHLWPWYYYPIVLALPFALATIASACATAFFRRPDLVSPGVTRVMLFAMCFIFVALGTVRSLARPAERNTIYTASMEIADFAETHPGIYAMGDRAGLVGFLLDQPVLHLEGLVANRQFLSHIARERDLIEVLREYKVQYYIATNPEAKGENCWSFAEPHRPGPRAPRMRGQLCAAPIASLEKGGVVTLIFRIDALEPQR